MNGQELMRVVDSMHRDKNIPKDVIFEGIEAALLLAARKHYEEEEAESVSVTIDRESGDIHARKGEDEIDPAVLGRIAAQSAKQVMIQKIREAECNAVYDEYIGMKGDLVHGSVQRFEGSSALVSLGKSESLLPRSEQIPGETHHVGERVKAIILDVRRAGNRVRIILSRTHPDFVKRLFELEIPEISDRTIDIRAISREAGYRSKIAVSSIDSKVDAVGACVGVQGRRIKNIVDELGGERIDIVRWNESLQVMIPNALQPAAIEEVFLYSRLGRTIVLVKEDQLSLAIGRRGQNVRLASKLVGWDIEIMTHEELNDSLERAMGWFGQISGVTEEMIEAFIEEGFLSYDDLTFMEPAQLAELAGVSEEQATEMIAFAEQAAEQVEEDERQKAADRAAQESVEPEETAPVASSDPASSLFGDAGQTADEAKPTVESLFGPTGTEEPAAENQTPTDEAPETQEPETNGQESVAETESEEREPEPETAEQEVVAAEPEMATEEVKEG